MSCSYCEYLETFNAIETLTQEQTWRHRCLSKWGVPSWELLKQRWREWIWNLFSFNSHPLKACGCTSIKTLKKYAPSHLNMFYNTFYSITLLKIMSPPTKFHGALVCHNLQCEKHYYENHSYTGWGLDSMTSEISANSKTYQPMRNALI